MNTQPRFKKLPHPTTVYFDSPSMKFVPDVVTNSAEALAGEDLGSTMVGGGGGDDWHWE